MTNREYIFYWYAFMSLFLFCFCGTVWGEQGEGNIIFLSFITGYLLIAYDDCFPRFTTWLNKKRRA